MVRPSPRKNVEIGIIGAGFGGLILANFLEQKKSQPWTYKIFESKHSSIPIIGTIRSHNARMIMKELDLLEEACKDGVFPGSCSGEALVNREQFLELLRRKVRIQYSCRVIDIIPCTTSQEEQKYHRPQRRQTRNAQKYLVMDDERIHGPFDLVVVANGLFGGEKLLEKASARIGDCRWHQERRFWFDFGITRIKRGADIAIQDGLRIGRQLEKNLHKIVTDNNSENYDHLIDTISFSSSNDKFPIIFLILSAIMALLYHLLILNLSKE